MDSGAAENVLPAGNWSHVNSTPRSEAGIGFRGAGGERVRNHGQRKFKVRMTDGHVVGEHMAGGGREETAHVSGQEDGRSRESCASRQKESQDSQTEG